MCRAVTLGTLLCMRGPVRGSGPGPYGHGYIDQMETRDRRDTLTVVTVFFRAGSVQVGSLVCCVGQAQAWLVGVLCGGQ